MERDAVIVAGFGFRAAASIESLRDALAVAQHGRPRVDTLAAPDDKLALVRALVGLIEGTAAVSPGLVVIGVSGAALRSVRTPTRSIASLHARATGSVAEAAALAAAGPGARLLTSRHISSDRMATCAIAQGLSRGSRP